MASVYALTAIPSTFPAFAFAWMSDHAAPRNFMIRCRSATTSPAPIFTVFDSVAHPAAHAAVKPRTTRPAHTRDRLIWSPLRDAAGRSGGCPVDGGGLQSPILFLIGGMDLR